MTKKFHINPRGEVKPCGASTRGRRFGGEHYESKEEAHRAIEKQEAEKANLIVSSHSLRSQSFKAAHSAMNDLQARPKSQAIETFRSRFRAIQERLQTKTDNMMGTQNSLKIIGLAAGGLALGASLGVGAHAINQYAIPNITIETMTSQTMTVTEAHPKLTAFTAEANGQTYKLDTKDFEDEAVESPVGAA